MSGPPDLDDYHWLISETAEPWLTVAADRSVPLHRRAAQLRQSLTAAQTHLVLQQAELRSRAADKFSPCETLFLTPVGLQQATDQWIAAYKARRFPTAGEIVDLCCGIGGDLLALGQAARASGYDRDPVAALFASENVRRRHADAALAGCVSCADILAADLHECAAWHIDPDRRDGGRRTVDPAQMSPSLGTIERLLAINGNAALKLAPATLPPDQWREQAELEWISRGRECRQLVAWFGCLAQSAGIRRATILGVTGAVLSHVSGEVRPLPHPASGVLDYVCEPDPAVLAAGLAGHVAEANGLLLLAADIPYFTSGTAIADPAIASFHVDCVLPFDEKRIASALRGSGVGTVEIKHRGVRLDPQNLRRRLRLSGDRSGVLIISPHNGRNLAIIATRVKRADTAASV